jgi:hypothetical protein
MSSIRKTPEHAAYGLLSTEAVAVAAADEAAEEVAEAAEAAEEAAVSGLDPSGSASSSSSLRSRVKAGEASSATRPGKGYFYFEEEPGVTSGREPADQGRSAAHRRQPDLLQRRKR